MMMEIMSAMFVWVDRWIDGWMNGSLDGWIDGWMNGSLDGWMDRWMDACMDCCDHRTVCSVHFYLYYIAHKSVI